MNHRQPGSTPRSTPPAQTASKPRLLCGFAENYPPPAHNRKSEPMSNITPAIDESARHQARVLPFNGNHRYRPFLPASERHLHGMPYKQSAVLREIINRNPFCRNDFRAILFEWQHPWFAFIGFRTFQGLLSSSLIKVAFSGNSCVSVQRKNAQMLCHSPLTSPLDCILFHVR